MIDGYVFSLEAVRLLLENGGDVHVRDNTGRTVILYVAHYVGESPNLDLLDVLLERKDISREDKLDALEMAGAILLRFRFGEEKVALAFRYWRQALALRLMNTEDNRPIYKTPTRSMNGSLSEWSTLEDLIQLEQDPSQHEMQSLLVRLRIYCSLGWQAVLEYLILSHSIELFLVKGLNGQRSISQGLDLYGTMFSTVLSSDRPFLRSRLFELVNTLMLVLNHLPKDDPNFNSNNWQKIVDIVFMVDPSYFISTNNQEAEVAEFRHMQHLADMVKLLSRQPEAMTEKTRLLLIQLVRRDVRDPSGCHLLHHVCLLLGCDTLPAIRFLVRLGADPNARDNYGHGVLHFLAMMQHGDCRDAAARLFLELGTHLDLADKDGKTAADLWLEKNNQDRKHLPDWLEEGVPKLVCVCARVIRRHGVPYKENNVLPAFLVPFVSLH